METKIKIRDIIAFPIGLIAFFFLCATVKTGGKWTAERFMDFFQAMKE